MFFSLQMWIRPTKTGEYAIQGKNNFLLVSSSIVALSHKYKYKLNRINKHNHWKDCHQPITVLYLRMCNYPTSVSGNVKLLNMIIGMTRMLIIQFSDNIQLVSNFVHIIEYVRTE